MTAAGVYGPGHGVFFNGAGGDVDSFGPPLRWGSSASSALVQRTITLKNENLAPLDLDGDGMIDLLHMPKVKTYSVYTPDL